MSTGRKIRAAHFDSFNALFILWEDIGPISNSHEAVGFIVLFYA